MNPRRQSRRKPGATVSPSAGITAARGSETTGDIAAAPAAAVPAAQTDFTAADPQGRVTLREVAALAGVSHMTASRVVRGQTSVAEKTAEKVRAAIAATGYRPDPALSALAAYRTPLGGGGGSQLAFIDCDGTAYSARVLEGIRAEARLYGYNVEVHSVGSTLAQTRSLSRMLFHRGVRGLFFGPSETPQVFEGWDWKEFAAVSLGALVHRPALHSVAMDYFDSTFSGFRLLYAQGCRRIAHVVSSPLEGRTDHHWFGGYCAALQTAKDAPLLYWDTDVEERDFIRWVRRNRVDGILTIHGKTVELLHAAGIATNCPPAANAPVSVPRSTSSRRPASLPAPSLVRVAFLNEAQAGAFCGLTYSTITPESIGAEGLRFIHHLLLRREFGLPLQPRTLAVRGKLRQLHP